MCLRGYSNFGIFKHPGVIGTGNITTPVIEETSTPALQIEPITDKSRRTSNNRNDTSTAQEQLKAKGFEIIQWYGKCEAGKVSIGTHDVLAGDGGMYGLIFDNTFSKQLSKTATLVMLTYPSNTPPKSSHYQINNSSSTIIGKPVLGRQTTTSLLASGSVDSFQNSSPANIATTDVSRGNSVASKVEEHDTTVNHTGVLSKRRRKKGQGYANRFFSLDFATCTLSYYYNRNSSALRGAIPLNLAAITADKNGREINIDSGAEIWHLKAANNRDFEKWTQALQKASNIAHGLNLEPTAYEILRVPTKGSTSQLYSEEEEQEWEKVEALVSRVVGTRDAIQRLLKKIDHTELKQNLKIATGNSASNSPVLGDLDASSSIAATERKSFWKRKCTPSYLSQNASGVSLQLSSPETTATDLTINCSSKTSADNNSKSFSDQEFSMHGHCSALLNDLNAVLSDFSKLLAKSKRRRINNKTTQRYSVDSISTCSTAEFFDAEPGHLDRLKVYKISHESQDELGLSDQENEEDEPLTYASSISSVGSERRYSRTHELASLFPSRPKVLDPLPVKLVTPRRTLIPPASTLPPSLISFLRKNVGKDLSTISMPVSANEPTSLLQRTAEQFENAYLLSKAASQQLPEHRLCYVTAFAISNFSINRCKERALRKPFNPMLGETFELLRTDDEVPGGLRFIAEKVSHRPVRIACQADSLKWSVNQSPAPTNKFWGKSAEIITEGRARLVLHLADNRDELYSWTVASAFLRNVVMGEKYIEPVGTSTVVNESTGAKAIIEFKSKGMFGGRSEDVDAKLYGPNGERSDISLIGTWTKCLSITEAGKSGELEIWRAGELIENAAQRYGLTLFAATLNEITQIEKDKIPLTDCRLRPDQRAAENGNLDKAEEFKALLEEKQRAKRKEMEENEEVWQPRWFVQVEGGDEGEEVWKLKSGKDGYWEERTKGTWTGVRSILSVSS